MFSSLDANDQATSIHEDVHCLEISILTLKGIVAHADQRHVVPTPPFTATVAFGGSVAGIEVISSVFCGYTGRIIVESEGITTKRSGLVAEWKDREQSASVSGQNRQPHSRICSHPVKSNRVRFHKPPPVAFISSLVETYRTAGNAHLHDAQPSTGSIGRVVESESNPLEDVPMPVPDIIELSIRLRSQDSRFADQIGVAHLILHNQEEENRTKSYFMDLPVKAPRNYDNYQPIDDSRPAAMLFGPDSRLRVSIISTRLSDKAAYAKACNSFESAPELTSLSSDSTVPIKYSRSVLERNIRPLLDNYRLGERVGAERRGMQVAGYDLDRVSLAKDGETPIMCGSFWSIQQFFRMLVTRCDDGADDAVGRSDMSIDSTILTRESMML